MINITVLLISLLLIAIILIQNPKDTGLIKELRYYTTKFISIKDTNNILDTITWILILLMMILVILGNK
ncbi:MAG: preprotein translocase subunit SecG [Bacteroides sp.]|nr:MAG: preprotein translocase subunit SecG [Bacteroides sp.]